MGFARLLLLTLSMLIGTLAVGLAPISISLSPGRVVAASTFGAGLLVGAALGVILPEGIEAVYSASTGDQSHVIAYSLSIGFAVMFIIDTMLNQDATDHPAGGTHSHTDTLDEQEYFLNEDTTASTPSRSASRSASIDGERNRGEAAQRAHSLSTVVGLLVHSLADGISLGSSTAAAASVSAGHLDLVIFAAILIHKAPAAFGLTTVLLADKAPLPFIRRVVLLFSLAAPVGAIATYAVLRLISSEPRRLQYATGVALLLSAGTFLFVATHIVTDSSHAGDKMGRRAHAGLVLLGLVVPLVLNMLSEHVHE